MYNLTHFLRAWLLLPGVCLILIVLAMVQLRRRPRLARVCLGISALALYICALPWVSRGLLNLYADPPLPPDSLSSYGAEAVVVLTGGAKTYAPEFGRSEPNKPSLIRARYGAFVQKKTGLPLLFTGASGKVDEAQVMADMALEMGCAADKVWIENESRTTRESAKYCVTYLGARHIHKILLVSQAFHVPRSARVFRWAGFEVVPAPCDFPGQHEGGAILYLVPHAYYLSETSTLVEEMIGSAFYWAMGKP